MNASMLGLVDPTALTMKFLDSIHAAILPAKAKPEGPPVVTAVLAFRNERQYLANSLRHLVRNDIRFALIDNESNDGSRDIALRSEFANHLVSLTSLPFRGSFDLSEQLRAKAQVIATLEADWVMHIDADEIMHSYRPGETLREAIWRSDQNGYNVIDFDEYVFLPTDTPYQADIGGHQPIRDYYFFQPMQPRLMRAWKKSAGLKIRSGGHLLTGRKAAMDPERMALRHYIFLDQEHAFSKYAERKFSNKDLSQGWHYNRLNKARESFRFPSRAELHQLTTTDDRDLRRDFPRKAHYWEWTKAVDASGQP
jgi:glycosyltransferase involved in cell wall biosynthesis